MLQLKFAIYHRAARAASLFSQASSVDVCSIGWRFVDQALFKSRVSNWWWRLSCP